MITKTSYIMTTEELNALIAQAKGGSVEAAAQLNAIAWEYQYGNNGRTIDLQMAYQLYTIAAECGNIDARATRAYCLYHGIGVEKDTQRSFQLYEQLANEGAQMGLSNLGWFYLGNSIEKDLQKAIYWFTRAAEEYGNIFSMKNLTHIYGEEDGFINHEQAAKWFLELIKRDCDPYSGVYENTGYNKGLYEKIKNAVLNSATEGDMLSSLSGCPAGGSLLGGAMYFTTSNAKSYINQAEEAIQRNIAYKEEQRRKAAEEEARKRAEEERARREAEERARREREERERQERERRENEERARREAEEKARWEREERERQERERREREEKEKRIQALTAKVQKDYDDADNILADYPCEWSYEELELIADKSSLGNYQLTLIVPEGVKRIGNNVFWNCNRINSIIFPNSLTIIGEHAFAYSTLCGDVIIPNGVTNINKQAFYGCKIKSITIPDSITHIGEEIVGQLMGGIDLETIQISNKDVRLIHDWKDFYGKRFNCITKILVPKDVEQRFLDFFGDYITMGPEIRSVKWSTLVVER